MAKIYNPIAKGVVFVVHTKYFDMVVLPLEPVDDRVCLGVTMHLTISDSLL